MPQSKKLVDKKEFTAAKQKAAKDFLKSKGHKNTDALDISDHGKFKAEILKLHNLTEEMYRNGAI